MSYFTRTFDGDLRLTNLKAATLTEPPKLNPLASCFKPRAARVKAEATTRLNAAESNSGNRAVDKTVKLYTPNPGETSGLVAYVNQRFCSVSRRDAQLLELLAPGPPLPARLQPACAYCHKRSPKICWHPFKDNLGRIICPLIGYKLAVLETYRKKHPSYQAIRSLHRRVLANQRLSSSSSGQIDKNELFKMPNLSHNGLKCLSSEEDAKLKRRYLKYEAERQSHEADYLRKLQECEKAYNNKSTGEVLSYMPVSERIASRSLRSSKLTSSKATSATRLDSKNRHSRALKVAKSVKGCATSSPLGEEVLSLYSDVNCNENERFPPNMNAFVERVLAHDDSCLSHITGSSNLSGSSGSHRGGSSSDSSGPVRGISFGWHSFARDGSPETFESYPNVHEDYLSTNRDLSSTEGSFIFSIAEKLEKAQDLNFYTKSPFSHVLDAFQSHLENTIRNEEISFSSYGRLMGSLLERCAMRRAAINKYLANEFFDSCDYQADLIFLALSISRLLPESKFCLRRQTYWKDLEYIYITAASPDGKINEEVRFNLLSEVEDIVSSSISNASENTGSSVRTRAKLNGNWPLGYSSECQTSSYGSDPSSYSDNISEGDANPIFEASETSRDNETNHAKLWQPNFRVDFPIVGSIAIPSIPKSMTWSCFPDSNEQRLNNGYTSDIFSQAGQNRKFQAARDVSALSIEFAPEYDYASAGSGITSPELHPEPLRSYRDFNTALLTLKLLDYFFDNYIIFTQFYSEEAMRNMVRESAYRESLEKTIEKLDKMVDKSQDGIKLKIECMKPNFEKVDQISTIWSSYKSRECYSLW